MLCKNPYIKDAVPFGCGQCTPCRINKRRLWTHRIVLEAMCHQNSAFVTLTYDPDNLPTHYENSKGVFQTVQPTLNPKDLKDWQKNLRYHAGLPLRFFSVGEYGDETNRPHYHAAVFGLPTCASPDPRCNCAAHSTLRASWKKGHVYLGTLTKDSAAYIAGYVTKKMTKSSDRSRETIEKLKKKGHCTKKEEEYLEMLDGRCPEFARMSNRPGIGAPALDHIKELLETDHGCQLLSELYDVPDIIKIGGQQMLLGSYLKNTLRKKIGVTDAIKEKKLQVLRSEKIEEYITYRTEVPFTEALSQKAFLINKNIQRVRDLEKRSSFRKFKGEL
jgi:hypothetical protein